MKIIYPLLEKIIREPENTLNWGILADYLEESGFPSFFARELGFSRFEGNELVDVNGNVLVVDKTNYNRSIVDNNSTIRYYSYQIMYDKNFIFFVDSKDGQRTELIKALVRKFINYFSRYITDSLGL